MQEAVDPDISDISIGRKRKVCIGDRSSSSHPSQATTTTVTIEAWPEYHPSNGGGFVSVRTVSPGNSRGGGFLGGEGEMMPPWAFALTERVRWLEQQQQAERESVYSSADRAKAK